MKKKKIRVENGYFIDENNNRWSIEKYETKNAVSKILNTMINCYDCVDCEECTNCIGCYKCDSCINCYKCDDCFKLENAKFEYYYYVL